jgi:hypothetical protein
MMWAAYYKPQLTMRALILRAFFTQTEALSYALSFGDERVFVAPYSTDRDLD